MTVAVPTSGDPQSARQVRLYPIFWRWHFLAALIVIPFVLWQSVTGTLYLWSEWWMDLRYPQVRFVPVSDTKVPPSAQMSAAFASTGARQTLPVATEHNHGAHQAGAQSQTSAGRPVQQIVLHDDPRRSTEVIFQGSDGLPYPVFVNPHTGQAIGALTSGQWLPGISRSLHAGWPLGAPGNWLLELGNCWAIVMIVTGIYLWWPRGRSLRQALRPRRDAGARVYVRDLHAIVAVIISAVFIFFLISALPWTSFWGGEVLSRAQKLLGQESPAGFSIGGASTDQMDSAGSSMDAAVRTARERGVKGTITVQLSPWKDAPLFVANRTSSIWDDRIVTAYSASGKLIGDFQNQDLPAIPRLVAVGIHVHQGDFGPVNVWLNTLLACSLIWLSITGIVSWWIRRPKGQSGVPPRRNVPWSPAILVPLVLMAVLLPLFGFSVVVAAALGSMMTKLRQRKVDFSHAS